MEIRLDCGWKKQKQKTNEKANKRHILTIQADTIRVRIFDCFVSCLATKKYEKYSVCLSLY
jgi:hypothetical protein